MKPNRAFAMDRRQFTSSLLAGSVACLTPALPVWAQEQIGLAKVAQSDQGVVATVHPLATEAALNELRRGGNAIDAAVAASLMLSVVDIHNSGLGGGGLALVRSSDGRIAAYDGRERAPMLARPESYLRDGQPDATLSQTGPLAAGTPGLVLLLERLSQDLGKRGWQEALRGASQVAEQGFPIDAPLARNFASNAQTLRKFPASAQALLNPRGDAFKAGETLVQRDLAGTLQGIAQSGSHWFYKGPFAEVTDRFMRQERGLLRASDLAEYYVAVRQPIECSYRNHRVFGFPPPSSGGIHIAQMLTMLAGFDVQALFQSSEAKGLHLLAEVMKRAMADRAYWLGDADFAKVPKGLLDQTYLKERAASIDLERSSLVAAHGQPAGAQEDLFAPGKHTTHLTVADRDGNVVALTQTINTSFGSKMVVPGTGVLLNNEMDDFSLAPGVRNAFGLLGSEANAVAPGKRPLSSMSPTIVLNEAGQFRVSCGAAGGPKIITSVLQTLVRVLDLNQSIQQAIGAPRIHHQWSPDKLAYETRMPEVVAEQLARFGHSLDPGSTLAVAQGIERQANGLLIAASDPRVPSLAGGL